MARILIAVVLLTGLLLHVGWQSVVEAFSSLDWWWLPALYAIALLGVLVQSLRWKVFLKTHDIRASTFDLFKKFWVSRFFNNFLPGQAGGDASRILFGWQKSVKKTELASSVIMDRVAGLSGLCLVATIAGVTHLQLVRDAGLGPWIWLAAGGAVGLLALVMFRAPLRWARNAAGCLPGQKLSSTVAGVLRDLSLHRVHRGSIARGVALGAVFYVVSAAQAYIAYRAFGVEVPIGAVLVIVPLVALIMAIPISINGWGVAEVVKVLLYAQFGVPEAAALSVALLGRMMLISISALGGLIYLSSEVSTPEHWRRARSWLPFKTGTGGAAS
ncbi:MAG: lysylphosphatidylglycerol synthase transmembrane domain-containing protein [Pseudomonadota bacterium]